MKQFRHFLAATNVKESILESMKIVLLVRRWLPCYGYLVEKI